MLMGTHYTAAVIKPAGSRVQLTDKDVYVGRSRFVIV